MRSTKALPVALFLLSPLLPAPQALADPAGQDLDHEVTILRDERGVPHV